jgi:hypothetical protein
MIVETRGFAALLTMRGLPVVIAGLDRLHDANRDASLWPSAKLVSYFVR